MLKPLVVFVVLWAPTGRKAWAALGEAPEPPRLFGNPPPALATILVAAAKH